MIKAPIKYFGGKGGMLKKLLAYFPPEGSYNSFIDAFGGSGVVLLNKPRVPFELYNDLDKNVYSLFKVLHDRELFSEFKFLCDTSFYDETTSREFEQDLRRGLPIVQRAYKFWYVNRTRRNGSLNTGFSINTSLRRGISKSTSDFLSSIENLNYLHERLSSVVVCNTDALKLVELYDKENTLIYLDPPYVHETRTSSRYPVEITDLEHEKLVEMLNKIQHAKIVLSGYTNSIYEDLKYEKISFPVKTVNTRNEKKLKVESVWRNFA